MVPTFRISEPTCSYKLFVYDAFYDAINKAASPYGILSVILIIIAGAVLYFAVLPRTLKGDQRKI